MPKQNPYLIENKKSIELVQELEKYEIKKSPLSLTARSKVVNKSGSNYVSDNKKGYGPMPNEVESLRGDYPNIARLLDYNRRGTINFLKANGALRGTSGSEIKLSSFDFDRLREVESLISNRGIEEAKRLINQYANR